MTPQCPYQDRSLEPHLMAACPGFRPTQVSLVAGAGDALVEAVTCVHLGVARRRGALLACCLHPGGVPVFAAAGPDAEAAETLSVA